MIAATGGARGARSMRGTLRLGGGGPRRHCAVRQADTATVVTTPSMPAEEAFTVEATRTRSVNRPEPVATAT